MALLEQLRKRQAETQAVSGVQSIHVKDSILFDRKDSAKIELDALYQLALGALEQLKKLDARLKPFEATLFSPSAKEFNREMQTKDSNARLDDTINTFLALLSPYFMLKPTHKVLEYLVRKYSIHHFNKSTLFQCILPYHQSMIFMKVINIIRLKGTNLWEFLEPCLHSGVPPKRSVIVDRMIQDRNLLLFVLKMLKDAVENRTSYKALFGFYTTTIMEAISTRGLSENMLRELWPFIVGGLSSADENYQTGTAMILACACWKAAVSGRLIRSAIDTLIAHTLPHLHANAMRSLIMIIQNATSSVNPSNQSSSSSNNNAKKLDLISQFLSEDTIRVISTWKDVPSTLSAFMQSNHYDVDLFVNYLFSTLSKELHKRSTAATFLISLVNHLQVPHLIPTLLVTLLESFISHSSSDVDIQGGLNSSKINDNSEDDEDEDQIVGSKEYQTDKKEDTQDYPQCLSALLSTLDLKYPQQVDQGVETMLQKYPENTSWTELFANGRHQAVSLPDSPNPTTITLGLRLNLPHVQIYALDNLLRLKGKSHGIDALIESTFLEHLSSGNSSLILNALDALQLGECVPALQLYNALENLISSGSSAGIQQKAFATTMGLFLNSSTTNTAPSMQSSSSKAKKVKTIEKRNSAGPMHRYALELNDAGTKLIPIILANLFNPDQSMSTLAIQAALQFHQHFIGKDTAPYQHVFSHTASSSSNLGPAFLILSLATSAVAHDDYFTDESSWKALLSHQKTRMIGLAVLNCALSQLATRKIQPHSSRNVEQEALLITQVLVEFFKEDVETMLLAVDLNVEGDLFALNLEPLTSPNNLVDGIPPWAPTQIYSLISSTAYYRRQYYFKYLIWSLYNVIKSIAEIGTAGKLSRRHSAVCASLFKLLTSSQNTSIFAPHFKILLSLIGDDVQNANFLKTFWLTPPATSIRTAHIHIPYEQENTSKTLPFGSFGSTTSPISTLRALGILHSILSARLASHSSNDLVYCDFLCKLSCSLMVPLSHHEPSIRLAACSCLQLTAQLLKVYYPVPAPSSAKSKSTPNQSKDTPVAIAPVLCNMLISLCSKRNELALSEHFFSSFISSIFSEATQEAISSCDRSSLHSSIISWALALPTTFAKYSILRSMRGTYTGEKLSLCLPMLNKFLELFPANISQAIIEEGEESTQVAVGSNTLKPLVASFANDPYTFHLLDTLISQWTPESTSILNNNNELFESLLQVLTNPFEVNLSADPGINQFNPMSTAIPDSNSSLSFSMQISALTMITNSFFTKLSLERQAALLPKLFDLPLSPKHNVKELANSVLRQITIDPSIIASLLQGFADNTQPSSHNTPQAKRIKKSGSLPQNSNSFAAMDKMWISRITVVLEMLQYKHESILYGTHYVEALFSLLRNSTEDDTPLANDPSVEYIEQLLFTTLIAISEAIANGMQTQTSKKSSITEGQSQPPSNSNPHMEASEESEATKMFSISLNKSELSSVEAKYDIDCVIQLIRARSNPTLQNSALVLLSHVARIFPNKVMANVMSIFSFMGASTERSDDNYTFSIIEKTVERVIPALLSHAPGVEGRVSASALLSIFVDRIDTIPQHRRLMLFTHILTKVLKRGYLPLVVALILHKHTHRQISTKELELHDPNRIVPEMETDGKVATTTAPVKTSSNSSTSDPNSLPGFLLTLFHKISPTECMSSLLYVFYWLNGNDQKIQNSPLSGGKTKSLTAMDKANMHDEVVQFAISYFSSRPLLNQLMELDSNDQQKMQTVYLSLFQALLMFAKLVSSDSPLIARSVFVPGKIAIRDNVYKLIDKVNEWMSVYTFFDVMTSLLKQSDSTIKYRAIVLFNERIKSIAKAEQAGFEFGEETATKFIEFTIQTFKAVVVDDESLQQSSEEGGDSSINVALNKQAVALTIEIVARLFGHLEQHHKSLLTLAELILVSMTKFSDNYIGSTNSNQALASKHLKYDLRFEEGIKVQASMIIAIATLCNAIREKLLPLVNKLFPMLMSHLRFAADLDQELECKQVVLAATLTATQVTVNVMHRFLSQYWSDLMKLLLKPSNSIVASPLWPSVVSILSSVADLVPVRLLMEPLVSTFDYVINFDENHSSIGSCSEEQADPLSSARVTCVKLLATLAGRVATAMDRATLHTYHKQLFKVFLTFFDYTETRGRVASQKGLIAPEFSVVVGIENAFIDAFMKLTLMLNENLFKPLFLVLLDWAKISSNATSSSAKPEQVYTPRSMFFFRLLLSLSEELKSIIVPYYSYVLDHVLRTLELAHGMKKTDALLKQNMALPSGITGGTLIHHQLSLIVDSLRKLFLYDNDGWLDKSKYDRIVPVLVDQLELSYVDQYKTRVSQSLVPCLGQLAVCASSDALWKPLNYQVLSRARHADAQVRLSILLVTGEFYHRLGESFLSLLPESAQTFSELMEDSSPAVERQCLALIKQIEQVLGEEGGVMSLLTSSHRK